MATLLEDLEEAAASINRDLARGDSDLASRLRDAAWRLREEMAKAELLRGMVVNDVKQDNVARVLTRINSGPSVPRPDTPKPDNPMTPTVVKILAVECPKCDTPAGKLCDHGPEMFCVGRVQAADGLRIVLAVAHLLGEPFDPYTPKTGED